MPVEAGNRAANEGQSARATESILADSEPEAAYFLDENGQRTAFIFFHIQHNSEIPKVVEPWMLAFNAGIEIHPARRLKM
jgi:hypothetical protein